MSNFPPSGCDWINHTGEYKPDYCHLGDALRAELEGRMADADTITRLRAEVERYRTALEKIAMKPGEMIPIPVHYEMNSYGEGLRLNQNIARAALEDGK